MKKTILILGVCTSLIFSACTDFLEEKPKSILTSADYFKTENQAIGQVNSLYRAGASTGYASASSAYIGPFASVTGMLTGYFRNSYEGQENICLYARTLIRQDKTNDVSNTMDAVWDQCYGSINVANGAIKYIPTITMNDTYKVGLVAEAKFFRAFNYFSLVKIFGAVPLHLQPTESMDNIALPRTPAADVYKQIESDLKDAVQVLPAQTLFAHGHRITKFVVLQTLTAVYMQEGKYAEAAATAKEIINSNQMGLVQNDDNDLKSAYNKLRTIDELPEVIFSYEYDDAISNSGWWPTYAFTSSATGVFNKYSITERVYGPSARFLNIYTDSDLRGKEKQFFASSYTNPTNGKTWTKPDDENIGCWYYFDQAAMEQTGKGTKDWNIYRYAETLLDAAECIVQSGKTVTSEAAGYLAQVQSRALGVDAAVLAKSLMNLSAQQFIETCWTERLREFPLEFKIWDDCVRTMKFPVVSETQKGVVTYVDLIGAKNGSGATFKNTDLLWPISLNEIQRNPKLEQNEGYAKSNSKAN